MEFVPCKKIMRAPMVGTVNRLNIRCELDTSTNSRHTLGVSKLY